MSVITTGVEDGTLGLRVDLRTFLEDADLTNLYLLGLQSLQAVDQSDPLSWYQISGIHGRPYSAYDGVGEGSAGNGYCTHSSIIFPTWHRPYLALFERELAKHVKAAADSFTDPEQSERYQAAAQRFRIPYWDWASDASLPPLIASQETVEVNTANGPQTIPNPLYSYKFQYIAEDFADGLPDEQNWESYAQTLRYPTATNPEEAQSRPSSMNATLANNRLTLRDRTYNLLTQAVQWAAFSNDGFQGAGSSLGGYDSLESIHGQIHGLVGQNGHMSVVDFAAFDPVFWLHHTNVDRLLTIWQAINPQEYVTPRPNRAGTFTTKPGTVEDSSSPLTPFKKTEDTFWTSDEARDTRTFGYTYPELQKWETLSVEEKRVRLRQEVNALYGKTAPAASLRTGAATRPWAAPSQQPHAVAAQEQNVQQATLSQEQAPAPSLPQAVPEKDINGHPVRDYYEWIANIKIKKYALDTTFYIHVFLGDFDADPENWASDPNLVGSHVVFKSLPGTKCEKCISDQERGTLVTGTIPLTGALGDRFGSVYELTPENVSPFLTQQLHWRVIKLDGTPVERSELPSLRVSVGYTLVDVPDTEDEFPVWSGVQVDLGVTSGRPGGREREDDTDDEADA